MFDLLAKIIPLDLAATLSPGIFAFTLILLGSKFHPIIRTLSFLFGTLLVGIAIVVLGFALGQAAPVDIKHNILSAIVDLVFGSLFIFLGIKAIISKERKINLLADNKNQILKLILIGLVISATNFDAVFLSFTAAKEVSGTQGIKETIKFILLFCNLVFFTLPILLPLAFYSFAPDRAQHILSRVNHLVLKYSKYLVFILLVIFGIIFLFRGLKFFLAN